MDQYLGQLQKLVGYEFEGTWLESALDDLLSKDKEDRGLDFEGMLGCGVPCDIEPPEYEPEDPFPRTSPAQLALHFSGLFAEHVIGPTFGGNVRGYCRVVDLNRLRAGTPLYLTKYVGSAPSELIPIVYVEDARPAAVAEVSKHTQDLNDLSVAEPPDPKRLASAAEAFSKRYPGLIWLQRESFEKRFGVKPSQEPAAAPAALQALYRAFERIAPAFIEAKGLPKPGNDSEASKLETALPSDSAYQAPRLLASILLPWAAGDVAKAKSNASAAKSNPASNALTQRWADRVLTSK